MKTSDWDNVARGAYTYVFYVVGGNKKNNSAVMVEVGNAVLFLKNHLLLID